MASLTYVCFVPAKGLIRDLSANSSNIAFEVPLAITIYCQILALFFSSLLMAYYAIGNPSDIRPDCHHHFDASGTSNAMFDE